MANLICKICGGSIEEHECWDTEIHEDKIILEKIGVFEKCKRPYTWQEYFFYAKTTEPELYVDSFDADEEWGDDGNLECGFDPYTGCYSDDC